MSMMPYTQAIIALIVFALVSAVLFGFAIFNYPLLIVAALVALWWWKALKQNRR